MHTESPTPDTLLFFGEDWGRHNSTGQYLAQGLNGDFRVLWWDSLGLRRPSPTPADLGRVGVKLIKFLRGPNSGDSEEEPNRPEVVTPLVIPYHGPRWIGRLNASILAALARKRGAYPPKIMVAACPGAADAMRHMPAALKVYYCADEYSSLPGMDGELVRRLEKRLLASVDLVVASSRTLVAEKGRVHPNVRYLPHGVDYEKFARALKDVERPPEFSAVEKPVVGFVGLMDRHTDTELLQRLSERIPEADFVFIGPCAVDNPPRGPNIHYLGPRPHESLYKYLAYFDVGIIPYRPGPFAEHANPTKLREYLAAGVPVISVPVPEARGISPYVRFAEGHDSFVEAVRHELVASERPKRAEISRSVADQSWTERGERLKAMLNEALGSPVAESKPVSATADAG